ncbi:hypothetical protein F5Y07DRAFT_407707 [Xylaria sp. FL0933]|nr:hypothetical protein F5Y07DRAFT_407707 [Xylaria sp. FL0933]
MPTAAGHFTLSCWNSTLNAPTVQRGKLMWQCHRLIQAVKARLTGEQIVVPSRDAKDTRKGIEICVMYRAGTGDSFANVTNVLNQESAKLHLDYKNFVEQEESLTRYFTTTELANLNALNKPITERLCEKDFEQLERAANDFRGFTAMESWSQGVPKDKNCQPITLMRNTLSRLRKAEGEDLKNELLGISNALNAAANAPKTSWQTIVGIGGGAIVIGGFIAKLTGVWAKVGLVLEVVTSVAASLTTLGVAAALAIVIVALAAIGGGLYLVFKDARNMLLVVNNTHSDIQPVSHDIYSGEVTAGTDFIPKTSEKSPCCYAGWYIYDKKTGFYGTTVGLVFKRGGGNVAIGLDCPNSGFGGKNSVTLAAGSDAADAQYKARSCHDTDAEVNLGTGLCSARIASNWGNVNMARLIFDGQ